MSFWWLPIQSNLVALLTFGPITIIDPATPGVTLAGSLAFSSAPLFYDQVFQVADLLKQFIVCGAVMISLVVTLVIVGREIQNAVITTARQSQSRTSVSSPRGEWVSNWR